MNRLSPKAKIKKSSRYVVAPLNDLKDCKCCDLPKEKESFLYHHSYCNICFKLINSFPKDIPFKYRRLNARRKALNQVKTAHLSVLDCYSDSHEGLEFIW